jgi:hypothetical protein
MVANGGAGRIYNSKNFAGNGEIILSQCNGTEYKNGLHSYRPGWVSCYGGQASTFGNGGSRSGQIPKKGAGGSAISQYGEIYDDPDYCKGGDGVVYIMWGDSINYSFEEVENLMREKLRTENYSEDDISKFLSISRISNTSTVKYKK